mgnify:CR=1 FL=1
MFCHLDQLSLPFRHKRETLHWHFFAAAARRPGVYRLLNHRGAEYRFFAQKTAKVIGTMDATAEGNIVTGATFRVRASSGAPEAQAIAGLFRDALESARCQVGSSSDLSKGYVLNFQFYGQSQRSSGHSRLKLRADSSNGH